MATKWYNPDSLKAEPPSSAQPLQKRRPFWMDPDVYLRPPSKEKGELSSDSIHVNDNQPLQVLFAGHVGAKGFPDPRRVTDRDLEDPVLRPRAIRSPNKDDIKRDLKRLDYIYRENVDDVIAHYLDGPTPSGSSTSSNPARFKDPPSFPRPLWDANDPPHHTRVIAARPSRQDKAAPAPKVVAVAARPRRDVVASQCSCCAEVNAENSRRRGDVRYAHPPSSILIDYPATPPSLTPSSVSETPEAPLLRTEDVGKALSRQPLSTIMREDPPRPAESRLRSDDLFLVYDDNNMHAGWVPIDELQRFQARKGGRVMYGQSGVAYINYEFPADQVIIAEDPALETQRRKLELDVLNSYGKYRNSMDRLGKYIKDLDVRPDSPEPSPVAFPRAREEVEMVPPRPRLPPPELARPTDRNVRFSSETPLQFVYTPQSTPQEGALR